MLGLEDEEGCWETLWSGHSMAIALRHAKQLGCCAGPAHDQAFKRSITDGGGTHQAPSLAEDLSVVTGS